MLPHRKIILALCLLATIGSVSVTIAYALHLHGVRHRERLAAEISDWLGLRVSIGRLEPQTLSSVLLEDVRAGLDPGPEEVFACSTALWTQLTGSPKPRHTLALREGWLVVGANEWRRADYARMLEGGLGHDFSEIGLDEVLLEGIDLRFIHPSLDFRASATCGVILFDDHGEGQASLNCARLNGVDVQEPVNISARFRPGSGLSFREVRLSIPSIPLAASGLGELVGNEVAHGLFAGTITYKSTDDGEVIEVEGALRNAHLDELTRRMPDGPLEGNVDLTIESARFVSGELERLCLHGGARGLRLTGAADGTLAALSPAELTLDIDRLEWFRGRLVGLRAHGFTTGIPLEEWSRLRGDGVITGTAKLILRSLVVVDDEVQNADLELDIRPPDGDPGTIDRAMLAEAAQRLLNVEMTSLLPERVEYARLGVRLVIEDGLLHIRGTHGPDGKTILTVNVFDRPMSLIREPKRAFDVSEHLADLGERIRRLNLEALLDWWETVRPDTSADDPS
jgi:hypothetical protein